MKTTFALLPVTMAFLLRSAPAADTVNDLVARARAACERGARDEALADYNEALRLRPDDPALLQERGTVHFCLGHIPESVADFDRFLALRPEQSPYHWQRGIALYYAGRFEDGRKQFELHKSVNPNDVENAAWHYLCVARLSGVEKARQSLILVEGDRRVPMAQVLKMFAGKATPDDVLAAARAGNPAPTQLRERMLYAHLYIGLFHEAAGKAGLAREHIKRAAEEFAGDDYMSDVARVHWKRMTKSE